MSLPCLEAFIYWWLPSGGKFRLLRMVFEEVLSNHPVVPPSMSWPPLPLPLCLFFLALPPSLQDQAYPLWSLHSHSRRVSCSTLWNYNESCHVVIVGLQPFPLLNFEPFQDRSHMTYWLHPVSRGAWDTVEGQNCVDWMTQWWDL